jgi:hypothetical protein
METAATIHAVFQRDLLYAALHLTPLSRHATIINTCVLNTTLDREEKTPKVLAALPDQGKGWTVQYAFFARVGFTEAAQAEAEQHQAQLVDLERLDRDLRAVLSAQRL